MPTDIRETNRTWEAVMTAHSALMRRFADEQVWREYALSMREYDVLYTMSKCPEPSRMGDLHAAVLLSQPALSRLVDRLVARGFVVRVEDPHDKRAVRVTLTPEGVAVQRAVGRAHARSVDRELRRLSPEEQRQLAALASKLVA